MGLRINTNVSAMAAIRNLGRNDRTQARSLEHLSTGLRINRASDDPSGLVISEQLRSQISSLKQAAENTQNDNSMIATADASLEEISNLLNGIKGSVVFALNSAGSSPEQISAEQDSVDAALSAIDRIVQTTRFADGGLINGQAGFVTTSVNAGLNDLNVKQVNFPPGNGALTITVDTTGAVVPTQASVAISAAAGAAGAIIRVVGPKGSADVSLGANATVAAQASAINNVRTQTGAYVDAANNILSEEFGSAQRVSVSVLDGSGTFAATALSTGQSVTATGVDATALINGATVTGTGRFFHIVNDLAKFDFSLASDPTVITKAGGLPAAGAMTFTVQRTGLGFQLGSQATGADHLQVGISSLDIGTLGFERVRNELRDPLVADADTSALQQSKGGRLKSLLTGGLNALASGNLANTTDIVDAAINQVTGTRSFLGSLSEKVLTPNQTSVEVAIQNLSASESQIRDLNFAEETSQFTKSQILFQTGIASLASANLVPQAVLSLLK